MAAPFAFMNTASFPAERSTIPAPASTGYGPTPFRANPDAIMGTIGPTGDPFGPMMGDSFNQLTGQIPDPFQPFQHPFDAWVSSKGIAMDGMATQRSQEDEKISMAVVMMGTTCTAGSIAFRFSSLASEEWEMNIVKIEDQDVHVSNHFEVCGNMQMANALVQEDQVKFLKDNGKLQFALNRAFDAKLLPPIDALVEKSKPIGFINREVGYVGGDSYHWKTEAERGFQTDEFPLSLTDLLQHGVHKKIPSIVPPTATQGQTVYIAMVPTKIYHGTVYKTGGRPLWSYYALTYPYPPGKEPFYWRTDVPTVEVDLGPGATSRDWVEIYQYQVFNTFEKRFPPELVAIDYSRDENQKRLNETKLMKLYYPHWWWKFGTLFGRPEFPHTGAPPENVDMIRASQDLEYQYLTLGDGGRHVLNVHVNIAIGMSGYGG